MQQTIKVTNITPKNLCTWDDTLKHIEFCGRLCYNSRSKIEEDSFIRFYNMLCKKGHLSPLAHGTLYLTIPNDTAWKSTFDEYIPKGIWKRNPWIRVNENSDFIFITTNVRFIYTFGLKEWLQFITPPSYMHTKRISYEVEAPISCTRELNRHAYLINGICELSTRYCNLEDGNYICTPPEIANKIEIGLGLYSTAINEGFKPEEAREVLPLGTMTVVDYTAFLDDWNEIMTKRSALAGAHGQHPICNEVADLIYTDLQQYN